jgi:hypothetical protein
LPDPITFLAGPASFASVRDQSEHEVLAARRDGGCLVSRMDRIWKWAWDRYGARLLVGDLRGHGSRAALELPQRQVTAPKSEAVAPA